jgi:hypothetical protein
MQKLVETYIEKDRSEKLDSQESQMFKQAFNTFVTDKIVSIIKDGKVPDRKVNIKIFVSFQLNGETISVIGNVENCSYRIFEEVLSYANDFDLSGDLQLGLKFSAIFDYDFFDEIIVKMQPDKNETETEIEQENEE